MCDLGTTIFGVPLRPNTPVSGPRWASEQPNGPVRGPKKAHNHQKRGLAAPRRAPGGRPLSLFMSRIHFGNVWVARLSCFDQFLPPNGPKSPKTGAWCPREGRRQGPMSPFMDRIHLVNVWAAFSSCFNPKLPQNGVCWPKLGPFGPRFSSRGPKPKIARLDRPNHDSEDPASSPLAAAHTHPPHPIPRPVMLVKGMRSRRLGAFS